MRIGIDGACWANRRGYGRFAREITSAMLDAAPQHEFVAFVDETAARAFAPRPANLRIVQVAQGRSPTTAASADGARSPLDMLRFTRAVARERLDVFFSPSVYTFFPLPAALPAVVTIHDAIAERFPHLTLPSRRARLFWNLKLRLALRQASLILTVSEHARREVSRVHGVPAEKLRVAVEAPSSDYRVRDPEAEILAAAARAGVPSGARWLVYVGGFNPHKNVDVVVRAHARAVAALGAEPPLHLVLVGDAERDVFHRGVEEIRAAVAEGGTGALVHWAGYVPDEELSFLLSGALALVLISEAEGFGLPAVEAAACGCPVIATTDSPLPELLAGGGFFVRPGDLEGTTSAILALAGDPGTRERMGRMALERARRLSWSAAADAALDALRQAAA